MLFDSTTVFNLNAVNWQSVSLLEGAHLTADRIYLEELVRCALFFMGRSGIVDLQETGLIPWKASSNSTHVGVSLKRCYAITPQGYLVCWESDRQPGEGVAGSADSSKAGETAPIYLCIDAERIEVKACPPQEIRNECSFLRPHLRLATETGEGELDALKIGRFKRDIASNKLELDKEFIPECLRLNSHWLLKRRIGEIQKQARTCLDSLVNQLQKGEFRLEAMAPPLASAAALVDWTISPYTYLERMLAVIHANFALQHLIEDRGIKANVYNSLEQALKYIEPNLEADGLDWAMALKLIEDTFKRLESAFSGRKDGESVGKIAVPPKAPVR